MASMIKKKKAEAEIVDIVKEVLKKLSLNLAREKKHVIDSMKL